MTLRTHLKPDAIQTVTARKRLPPRKEPYWTKGIRAGQQLGYRKKAPVGQDGGTWVALWTEPAPTPGGTRRARHVTTLQGVHQRHGVPLQPTEHYKRATELAAEYFARAEEMWRLARGGAVQLNRPPTVLDAIAQYLEHLKARKTDLAAQRARWKLLPNVEHTTLATTPLHELEPYHVEQWFLSLKTAQRRGRTANRILAQFKAAMNYAVKKQLVGTDRAWKNVEKFNDPDGRRNTYLTAEQSAALVAACYRKHDERELLADRDLRWCTPGLGRLLRAAQITGARPGELAKLRVADFDAATGTLRLVSNKNKHGEARPREFYLTDPQELEFFRSMAASKLPQAFLITEEDGRSWMYTEGRMAGEPRRRDWAAGMRAAVRNANKHLPKGQRIAVPAEQAGRTTMYTARHTTITNMLNEGVQPWAVTDAVGTSEAMLKAHYDQQRKERVRAELAKRAAVAK